MLVIKTNEIESAEPMKTLEDLFFVAQAKDLKVKIISEDDLLEMIASRPAGTGCPSPAPKKTAPSTPKSAPIPRAVKSEKRSPPEPKEGPKKTEPPAKPSKEGPKKTEPPAKPSNIVAKTEEAALPWVEKYKPLAASKIIGETLPHCIR